jgi:hypothetical protein
MTSPEKTWAFVLAKDQVDMILAECKKSCPDLEIPTHIIKMMEAVFANGLKCGYDLVIQELRDARMALDTPYTEQTQ